MIADNEMLVVRALTHAKKDGLSFYELQQATRLAALGPMVTPPATTASSTIHSCDNLSSSAPSRTRMMHRGVCRRAQRH